MKYIDAEKLITKIKRIIAAVKENNRPNELGTIKQCMVAAEIEALNLAVDCIKELQQEQSETDMKSPFTGGKVAILSREEEVTFRGEKIKIIRKYYRCVDTGREFTDSKLDDDMMWAAFRAYCEKKGMTSFTDIMLKQEQPDEQPEYGYLFTEYVHGKKSRWNVGDVIAYYICTSNEEGEYLLGKIVNVEFDEEDGWVYTFEDESTWDEQSLDEEGAYKKN